VIVSNLLRRGGKRTKETKEGTNGEEGERGGRVEGTSSDGGTRWNEGDGHEWGEGVHSVRAKIVCFLACS